MAMIYGSLSGLELVAEGEGSPRRQAILQALTNQYLDLEPRLSDRHVELYDNVFQVLVDGIEVHARLILAQRLGPVKRAPRETIRLLARDEHPAVAAPVLEQSPVLDEIDLVQVVRTCSEAHRAAVARRRGIGPGVSEVLVEKREPTVMMALIGNESAALSRASATVLSECAAGDSGMTRALAERFGMPKEHVEAILRAARVAVVNKLLLEGDDTEADAITLAVGEAGTLVATLPAAGSALNRDEHLVTLYSLREDRAVAEILSERSAIAFEFVQQTLWTPKIDAFLVVLKAAHIERRYVEAMVAIKLGMPPGSGLRVQREMAEFDRIKALDPQRMVTLMLGVQPLPLYQ
jgi:uncharacterized protein (DUF2336 family)